MRHVDLLHIFVASPSDVGKERACIDGVVADANRLLPKNHPVQFKVLGYERDVFSDIGEDAQSVINTQINDEYEVFLGIMWTRFGTPTKRAASGTEEEFERALARRRSGNDLPVVAFYIKNASPPANRVDNEQFEKVKAFRKKLETVGVLYKPFPKIEVFRYIVLIDLVLIAHRYARSKYRIDELASSVPREYNISSGVLRPTENLYSTWIADEKHDFSFFARQYGEAINGLMEYANNLNKALSKNNAQVSGKRRELDALLAVGRFDRTSTGKVINKTGDYYDAFADELRRGLPVFMKNNQQAVNALFGIIREIPDLISDFDHVKHNLANEAEAMIGSLDACRMSMLRSRGAIIEIPRSTSHFNRSRKKLAQEIERTCDQFLISIFMFKAFKENIS